MSAEQEARRLCKEWLELDRDPETRKEVEDRLAAGEYEYLAKVMNPKHRLEFGTAGLRGGLCAGYARMNELLITQTAQAMYHYSASVMPIEELKKRGICLAYDGRRKSKDFAELTAATFLAKGITVRLFRSYAPTPYASYACQYYGAAMGVMVTASHNPSTDNGYKIYGMNNGVQITPPHDGKLYTLSMSTDPTIRVPWPETADRQAVLKKGVADGLLEYLDDDSTVMKSYKKDISILKFFADRSYEGGDARQKVRIGYSAMWGVGYLPVINLLEEVFKFSKKAIAERFFFFEDEIHPDSKFGGEAKPNPEERHNMVRLATKAEAENARNPGLPPVKFVMATDPDADRLAVAELITPSGATLNDRWFFYHGNHVGVLLTEWALFNYINNDHVKGLLRERGLSTDPSKYYISNSTVSSKALVKIADAYGCQYQECLTGFKWIGSLINDAKKAGLTNVMSWEESIGYTLGGIVTDKDGCCTAGIIAELVVDLYEHRSKTLYGYMKEVMAKYGFYTWTNSSIPLKDMSEIEKLFVKLNGAKEDKYVCKKTGKRYATKFGGFDVLAVRDCQAPGYDSRSTDNVPNLPVGKAPMLTFWCSDNIVVTLRPSGTEPKCKYYVEAIDASFDKSTQKGKEFADVFLKDVL